MKPIKTPHTNTTFSLLGGTEENNLPIERGTEDGQPVLTSVWELTDEEREMIASGGHVHLRVWGSGTPPVALWVQP